MKLSVPLKNKMKLRRATLKEFDLVFDEIENSFITDERRDRKDAFRLFESEKYDILLIISEETVIGFFTVWKILDFCFIEHFVIIEKYRSRGYGAEALGLLYKLFSKIVLETEPCIGEIQRRRLGFYKRCGFFLNEYPYMQPAISKGKREVPLMIMTYGKKITRMKFNDIKFVLYTNVYKISL